MPDIVDVYALAFFEHCPYENLTQDDMDSQGRIITSKDHLQRNIANCQILHVYNNGANAVGIALQFMGIYGNEENFLESGYERNYSDVIFCQVEVFGHEIQIN